MATSGASPSSSPRLPSPPPFTEVQIGPKSPTVSDVSRASPDELLGVAQDESSTRRIRPGTKAGDMASGPPLIPLSQLDSPFQLQEHLKALYHNYTRPTGSSTIVPITRQVATQLAEPPEGVERSLWLYELCRFLTMKVNNLIIAFFAEEPPCSAQTCPEMRASEWQYLCAVHDPPKSCCAIDYCCHTLDWATNILTSPKYFPSRLTLGSDAGGGPQASMRHLTNIFRRLYRIFAHAWFQHRAVFWQVEGCDGLYVFFKAVCDVYRLIPDDNYTVPPEAEGEEAARRVSAAGSGKEVVGPPKVTILRKGDRGSAGGTSDDEELDPASLKAGATTRRHRYSPSRGSSVTTITEAAEDDEETRVGKALGFSQSPVDLTSDSMERSKAELPTEDGSPPETAGDNGPAVADDPQSNLESAPRPSTPKAEEEEEESAVLVEDLGSPGPVEEHNLELEIIIQPESQVAAQASTSSPNPAQEDEKWKGKQDLNPVLEQAVETETKTDPDLEQEGERKPEMETETEQKEEPLHEEETSQNNDAATLETKLAGDSPEEAAVPEDDAEKIPQKTEI